MGTVKAGWHPAPENAHWVRWWSGKEWAPAYWQVSRPAAAYLPGAPRFNISARGEARFDVVGENFREVQISTVIGGRPARDQEIVWEGVAELVPEPDNPHDAKAVSVRVDGLIVGYLDRDAAREYFAPLSLFTRCGIVPEVNVRIWAVTRWSTRRSRDELKSAIRLALPAPHRILPKNEPPPESHYVIPRGRRIQVTGEQDHLDVLRQYVSSEADHDVVVTLHPVEVPRARSNVAVMEVRLDGKRIGQLSPVTSEGLRPLVTEAESRGATAAAWAQITGSRLAAEVVLDVTKAELVADSWPASSDRLPRLSPTRAAAPSSYVDERELPPPPAPTGLHLVLWVIGIILLLALAQIPVVGPLLLLGGLAGMIAWHLQRKRLMPRHPGILSMPEETKQPL
ncbi:HIRAN domain-containing protein [Homoserinimonas sp. A447]